MAPEAESALPPIGDEKCMKCLTIGYSPDQLPLYLDVFGWDILHRKDPDSPAFKDYYITTILWEQDPVLGLRAKGRYFDCVVKGVETLDLFEAIAVGRMHHRCDADGLFAALQFLFGTWGFHLPPPPRRTRISVS